MGRRKRLCITSTEIPERVEPHVTSQTPSDDAIDTQGDQSDSQGQHAIETEGDQSNSVTEISTNEQGLPSSSIRLPSSFIRLPNSLIGLHNSFIRLPNNLIELHNSFIRLPNSLIWLLYVCDVGWLLFVLILGSRKKVRGYTKKAETWKMNGNQKIIVNFDNFGKPVGDEGNELVQFLGTLVRMADHVSIEYSDWRKVPMQKKEDMYSLVKSKFVIHPHETSQIKKWIFYSMGKKWRTWKGALKARVYDPSLTIDEIVAQQTNSDNRVNLTQFKELATRWLTPEFQNTCAVRRSSRSKMNEPHVTGTKSFARLAHERAMDNNGVYPTRGEMYVTTRTRKDGSIVDSKAAEVVASLRAIASDSTSTPRDSDDFTNDDYSKVKGPEKQGYVRLVGRMPAVKENNANFSTDSQTIHQLKSVVNVMLNIIQEHIPNANLPAVLSNMNIEIPGGSSSVPNNSLSVNQRSPSGSNNNNGNHFYLYTF
ncbi:hypothetical protein OSB04_031319 [Centaurea solstitialis]|uniref:Uncharacterized protein n=1 Tax=Centaurea solstitialis TaxID=347529 RepID=A0AA38SLF7_9ASTR|nr:hypothetical protein OSB04_031319 [Centaurea solstitialis]